LGSIGAAGATTGAGAAGANGAAAAGGTTMVNGVKVNLAAYVDKHPGGPDYITKMMSMPDATAYFATAPHGSGAKYMAIVNGLAAGGNNLFLSPEEFYKFLHGVFMILGWGVFPFIGIFVARYLKDALGHGWFKIHVAIMVVGVTFFNILGYIFLYLATAHGGGDTGLHGVFGFMAIFLLVCQITSGIVSDKMWTADRDSIPWWDKAHWYMGRIAVIVATMAIYFGMVLIKWSNNYVIAFWVWIALCAGVFIYGEVTIGVVHHMKSDHDEESSSSGKSAH
jgi:hypothetical protein